MIRRLLFASGHKGEQVRALMSGWSVLLLDMVLLAAGCTSGGKALPEERVQRVTRRARPLGPPG